MILFVETQHKEKQICKGFLDGSSYGVLNTSQNWMFCRQIAALAWIGFALNFYTWLGRYLAFEHPPQRNSKIWNAEENLKAT